MRKYIKLIESALEQPDTRPSEQEVESFLAHLKTLTKKPEVQKWIDYAVRKYVADVINASDELSDRAKQGIAREIEYLNTVETSDLGSVDFREVRNSRQMSDDGGRKGFRGPKIAKINTDSPEFKRWFGQSKAVNQYGEPLVLFRGVQRHVDGEWETRFASLSFTPSSDVASVYTASADVFGAHDFRKGSTVYPVYMSLQKPVDMRFADKVSLNDILYTLRGSLDNEQEGERLLQLLNELEEKEEAGSQYQKTLPSSGWFEYDWEEFTQKVQALLERGKLEALDDLLGATEIDTYAIVDTQAFTQWAYEQGFDGVIHWDVFDAGIPHASRLLNKGSDELHGVDENHRHLTFRPFAPERQVKSIYNRGTWNPDSPNIGESKE